MKPFAAQTYYELLEISVSANAAEIRAACARLSRLYADDQLALYGLVQPGTAQDLRKRIQEATEILTDDELRSVYDEDLGLPPREKEPVQRQLEMGELLSESDHPLPRVSQPVLSGVEGPVLSGVEGPPTEPPTEPVSLGPPPPPDPLVPPELPAEPPPRADAPPLSEEAALSLLPRASPQRAAAPAPPEPERPKHPEITPNTEYNGEFLRSVRNALGLSLATVAERTRIGAKHLQNVEADRYDTLPATVYLRGILMNLARELKLDGLKVSKSYLSLVERVRSKG